MCDQAESPNHSTCPTNWGKEIGENQKIGVLIQPLNKRIVLFVNVLADKKIGFFYSFLY
jgi:hypothetical protein